MHHPLDEAVVGPADERRQLTGRNLAGRERFDGDRLG
jgi:hypothetical protein